MLAGGFKYERQRFIQTAAGMRASLLLLAAVTISVLIVRFISLDGESHWMEGVMLVAVHAMLAIAFYFLPA